MYVTYKQVGGFIQQLQQLVNTTLLTFMQQYLRAVTLLVAADWLIEV